jgi:hypothetical protein
MSSFIARLHIPVNPIIIIITFSHVRVEKKKKKKKITDRHISLLFFFSYENRMTDLMTSICTHAHERCEI